MNQRAAFSDTLALARKYGMDNSSSDCAEIDYDHLEFMYKRLIDAEGMAFSEAKVGRWLGWAQASVMAFGNGSITLDEFKELNRRHA